MAQPDQMKRCRTKNSLAFYIGLLVMANLACSFTSRVFQFTPSSTPKTATSTTSPKRNKTPTRKVTPTHHIPPAFLKLTASAASSKLGVSNHLATLTPLAEPSEETGNEEYPTEAIKTGPPKNSTDAPGKTPLSTTAFMPTAISTNLATVTITTAVIPTVTIVPSCGSTYNHQNEDDLLNWINGERQGQGLAELNRNKKLDMAALRHSLDMACTPDLFDHKGSKADSNSTIRDRILNAGYEYTRADETIYAASGVSDNPKSAFDTWKSLPASLSILFDNGYTEIGIGYVNNPNSTYGGYFTAVFAQP